MDEVTISSDVGGLSQSTFLTCGVQPPEANYTTRWITPNGDVVTPEDGNPRFTLLQGAVEIDRRVINGTALIIENLSYQDDGIYICEAQDVSSPEAEWVQAFSQLRLIGNFITQATNWLLEGMLFF